MSAISPAAERRIRHSIVAEVTRDTTPASPVYDIVPKLAGSYMQHAITQEVSQIARGDRQDGEIIGGTQTNNGLIKLPIIREAAFHTLLESALSNAFGSFITSGAITGTFATPAATFTRAAGDFTAAAYTALLKVGDKVAVTGTANQGSTLNTGGGSLSSGATSIILTSGTPFPSSGAIKIENEWISYTGKSTNTLTGCTRGAFGTTAASHADSTAVSPVKTISAISSGALTFSEACVAESSISTTFTANRKQLVASTTRVFFTLEQYFADLDIYEVFSGQEVNTCQITIPTSGQAGADFNLVGLSFDDAQVASSTYTDIAGNAPCSGSVSGTTLLVDGAALSTCIETMQINLNNNRAAKFGVGSAAACLVEEGSFEAEAQFTAYFVSGAQRDKFINGTRFSMEIRVRDQRTGHGYNFCFPRLAYRTDTKSTSGQTVTEQFTAYAERDATIGSKFYVEQFIAA